MFNIGFSELLVVGVIALIFIGPQQLPEVARTLGRFINELRRASEDFKGSFTANVGTDLQERLREARRDVHHTIAEVRDQVSAPITVVEHEPATAEVPAELPATPNPKPDDQA